jgi:hypothetical protein
VVNLSPDVFGMEDLMLQAAFRAPAGEWHRVRLAFQDFITTVRGMEAEAQVLELPNRVTRVGVLSAERRAGPFRLELDWIKLVSLEASHRGRYRLGIKHPRRAYEQAQAIEVPNPAPSLSAPDLQFRTSNSPPPSLLPPLSIGGWMCGERGSSLYKARRCILTVEHDSPAPAAEHTPGGNASVPQNTPRERISCNLSQHFASCNNNNNNNPNKSIRFFVPPELLLKPSDWRDEATKLGTRIKREILHIFQQR